MLVPVAGERAALLSALSAHGVDPEDFGRFVNRVVPGIIEPSRFDAERATPVLLEWLPRVANTKLKTSIVRHLKTRAARGVAAAALITEFRATTDENLRWTIGDVLGTIAGVQDFPAIVELAADGAYGRGRQMLVYILWRAKTDRARTVLTESLTDPDVALHAGSALRRLVGNEQAVELLSPLTANADEGVAQAACRNLASAQKAISRARPT